MIILLIFAFLAGIVTVISPCVIPVLPALLAGGTGKGVYRPLGIILGLIASFTFFTLALTFIVQATGISPNILRYIAITVLALFGLVLLFPKLSDWFASSTSGIATIGSNIQSSGNTSSGFVGGFILGIALGLLWTPCAGPILAAISTLVASNKVKFDVLLLTLAYSIGAGIPMFLIAYGGNKALTSSKFLSKHAEGIRQFFGGLMMLTALAIAFNFDMIFEQYALSYLPILPVEDNSLVKGELDKLRGFVKEGDSHVSSSAESPKTLRRLGDAPEIIGITEWLNSSPLRLAELKGKVVLIDFWTYSCINCVRTLPYITRWYDQYKDKGFVVIGVHTPEFEFEKIPSNVSSAIKRFNIHYPVALDNNYRTWNNYSNRYWPAHYLIDKDGMIREVHFGEGAYAETENAIRTLLDEKPLQASEAIVKTRPISPETYLGYQRADHYPRAFDLKNNTIYMYDYPEKLLPFEVALKGKWNVEGEKATSESNDSFLFLNFMATKVYLVLSGESKTPVIVTLDDKPLAKDYYSSDMDSDGGIIVNGARMYTVLDLKKDYGRHVLGLRIPKGISAYAFTFGDE